MPGGRRVSISLHEDSNNFYINSLMMTSAGTTIQVLADPCSHLFTCVPSVTDFLQDGLQPIIPESKLPS